MKIKYGGMDSRDYFHPYIILDDSNNDEKF